MKKCLLTLFIVFTVFLTKAQITQGIVTFTTITVDTVNNITTYMPDTVLYTYSFTQNAFSTFYGTDSVNNCTIVNNQGTYVLTKTYADQEYTLIPTGFNLDTLINTTDTTAVKYVITTQHLSILGYYCTMAYQILPDSTGKPLQTNTIWYTSQVKGYNFIPGAGGTNVNLNGLILQYEYPVPNGTTTVTATGISTTPINAAVFNPNLAGYVNTDTINNTGGGAGSTGGNSSN